MTKLATRIAFIKASPHDDKWKAQQIEGAKLTYERLEEQGPVNVLAGGVGRGYWPAYPKGERPIDLWAPDMHPRD